MTKLQTLKKITHILISHDHNTIIILLNEGSMLNVALTLVEQVSKFIAVMTKL